MCSATCANEYTPRNVGHMTTRQDVQFHFVMLEQVAHVLRLMAEVGLTTREACGNTVRNVTSDHCRACAKTPSST